MKGRIKVFSERLFITTHVSLAYIASALSSLWNVDIYAKEALASKDLQKSLRPIKLTDKIGIETLVQKSDIVHCLVNIGALSIAETIRQACASTHIPFVISLGGTEIYEWLREGPKANELFVIMNSAYRIVVATKSQQDLLLSSGDLCEDKVTAINPGLPLELEAYKPDLFYDESKPFTICFIGRLRPRKNVIAAFNAFQIVSSTYPNSRFIVIGDGPEKEPLLQKIRESGLEQSCTLLGTLPHSQTLEVLRSASVLCCPAIVDDRSTTSALSFVVLESQAIGVPVVATRVGGIVEGIINGETGFLSSSSNPQELAKYMLELASNPRFRLGMSIAAREWIQNNFNIKDTIKSLDNIYSTAIKALRR